jgi:hypothetical protein
MPSRSYLSSPDRPGARRRRGVSMGLAVAAHLLLLLLLWRLSPPLMPPPERSGALSTFNVAPEARTASRTPSRTQAVARRRQAAAAPPAAPTPPRTPPPPVKTDTPFPTMLGGSDLFRSADIAKIPSRPGEGQAAAGEESGDSVAAYGPGEGPGGQRLYNAQWYREPTNAELAFYLPKTVMKGSWAIIACRTIERYQVDSCRSLDESPPGSGLARGLREAAWQFRVLPPRVGGKSLVGAWVRIRVDFTEKGGVR